MFELPLFPLHTVLFPGAPLQLHIFEERYQRMIDVCLQERRPFGVALIRKGVEALGPLPEPYPVGCSAQIIHVRHLEHGRMDIVAVGQERVRIFSVDPQSQPFLLGTVESYPMQDPHPEATERQAGELRPQVERFIQTLVQAGGEQFDLSQLPGDPIPLSYMAAALLQISPAQKQQLLELERADELLAELKATFRRENALLPAILSERDVLQRGGFSRN